jgi:hypothetical protein
LQSWQKELNNMTYDIILFNGDSLLIEALTELVT